MRLGNYKACRPAGCSPPRREPGMFDTKEGPLWLNYKRLGRKIGVMRLERQVKLDKARPLT